MSLDINFMYPVDTFKDTNLEYIDIQDTWHDGSVDCHLNITHNLGEMASKVEIELQDPVINLYDVLWRPYRLYGIDDDTDKAYSFMPVAGELEEALDVGIAELKQYKDKYTIFNPSNGWGNYEGLLRFCEKYLESIRRYPHARIQTSR